MPKIILENITYNIFYEEFYRNYLRIREDDKYVILASIYLHLTYEVTITYLMRLYLRISYGEDSPIMREWYGDIEEKYIKIKIDFFCKQVKFRSSICKDITKIMRYNGKLASLRNSLVHGHEISETTIETEKKSTKIKKQLTAKRLAYLYKGFWESLNIFWNIFDLIEIPKGLNPQFIHKDLIEDTANMFKEIENKLNALAKL